MTPTENPDTSRRKPTFLLVGPRHSQANKVGVPTPPYLVGSFMQEKQRLGPVDSTDARVNSPGSLVTGFPRKRLQFLGGYH